jgi:hypothetical protein
MDRVPFLFKNSVMTETLKKKLLDELGEAMMNINAAECVFIDAKESDGLHARELSRIWHSIYVIRQFYKDGSVSQQSKGEPVKTA